MEGGCSRGAFDGWADEGQWRGLCGLRSRQRRSLAWSCSPRALHLVAGAVSEALNDSTEDEDNDGEGSSWENDYGDQGGGCSYSPVLRSSPSSVREAALVLLARPLLRIGAHGGSSSATAGVLANDDGVRVLGVVGLSAMWGG